MEAINFELVHKECPRCGASIQIKSSKCSFCNTEFYTKRVSDLSGRVNQYKAFYNDVLKMDNNSVDALYGLGLCSLKLNLFDRAKDHFDSVINKNPEHAYALFYYSASIISGRNIRNISFKEAKAIERNLNAAMLIEPETSVFIKALAIIKHDYYLLNGLQQTKPDYQELLSLINDLHTEDKEILSTYFKSNLN